METTLNRNEKLIAFIALIAVAVFFVMFLVVTRAGSSSSAFEIRSGINYKMARPNTNYSEYSLSGRDIDQVYDALKTPDQKKKTVQAKATAATTPKKVDTKTINDAHKKSAAQSQQQKQESALAEQKSRRESLRTDAKSTSDQNENSHYSSNSAQNVGASENVNNNSDVKTDEVANKKKKTFAEWRALVFSQPTRETINLFVEAFKKNEVTQAEFQALSQDLLDQNDDKLKGLGLYALRANPSLASLSQLVHIEADLSATYKTYVDQAYISYLLPQNIGYLNQALQTKDKTLILKSLNLLGINLHKIAQGDTSAFVDPRSRRDVNATSQVSMSNFKSLLPALMVLSASPDQDLSPLAQQVTSYIQSTNTIAVN